MKGMKMAKNLGADLYRIAEEAHKTASEKYIRELCEEVAREHNMDVEKVYRLSERVYASEFESQ